MMNTPLNQISTSCDVLVVGAGPAGSAAALDLARNGFDVVLIDRHTFPREKICGDGLIPDAHEAMRRMGVYDEVMAKAQQVSHVRAVGPSGKFIDVPGTLAVMPRIELDDILCRAAVRAGARMVAPARFESPIRDATGRVIGANLTDGTTERKILAKTVLLATGAAPQAIIASDMCLRRTPSCVAIRAYVKNEAMSATHDKLEVVWHPMLKPGYGWIFPGPDGVFNIGVAVIDSHRKSWLGKRVMRDVNLREMFQNFVDCHAGARTLMQTGTQLGDLKGAPFRCSLEGAQFAKPGILVTGEAAGATYTLTGEGIGKAMQTALLASQALISARNEGLPDSAIGERYEAGLLALRPRYDLYEQANRLNEHPWLADIAIWRANRSSRMLQRMSNVLNETSAPADLLSIKGIKRLILG